MTLQNHDARLADDKSGITSGLDSGSGEPSPSQQQDTPSQPGCQESPNLAELRRACNLAAASGDREAWWTARRALLLSQAAEYAARRGR